MLASTFKSAASLGLVLLIVGGCYAGALQNGYVWDDWFLFIHNPALRLDALTWAALSAPVMDGTTYFRPLVLLSFWAQFRLFGLDAIWAHAVNIAIHLANVSLVFLIAKHLCHAKAYEYADLRAAIAASFYGLHPSLVEAAAWTSGRFDLLATCFVALGLLADLYARSHAVRPLVFAILFACALGSKEVGIVFPVVLLAQRLHLEVRPGESLWQTTGRVLMNNVPSVFALSGVFLAYMALRFDLFDAFLHVAPSPADAGDAFLGRLLFVVGTFRFYITEVLYPFTSVGPLHPLDSVGFEGVSGAVNVLVTVVFLVFLVIGIRKRVAPAVLLASAVVAILPVLNIIPLLIGNNVGSDRFLTLPLVFCSLAIATCDAGENSEARRAYGKILLPLTIVWTACAAMITYSSIPQWKDDFTLWTSAYRQHPDSPYAKLQVASAAIGARRFDIADALFRRFREQGPLERSLQLNYGGLLIATGELDEGRKYVEGALLAFPPLHSMAEAERAAHRFDTVVSMDIASAYRMLAVVDLQQGKFDAALRNAEISTWYKPNFPIFMTIKALALMGVGRLKEGDELFAAAVELDLAENKAAREYERTQFISDACHEWPDKGLKMCNSLGSS